MLLVPTSSDLVKELDGCQPVENLLMVVSVLREAPPAKLAATIARALYHENIAHPENDDLQLVLEELYFFKSGLKISISDDGAHLDRLESLPTRLAGWFPRLGTG